MFACLYVFKRKQFTSVRYDYGELLRCLQSFCAKARMSLANHFGQNFIGAAKATAQDFLAIIKESIEKQFRTHNIS